MPLDLIFNANSSDQSASGALDSFNSEGTAPEENFVRGDINLAISLRPVVPSVSGTRPWDDDWLDTDAFEVGIGTPDDVPDDGQWPLAMPTGATITNVTVANPSHITTDVVHGLLSGDSAYIFGNTGSTPEINGLHVVTVIDATHFTIPVNVTVAGTGGIIYDATGMLDLDFNESASALQAIISPLSTKHGYSAVVMELLSDGTYQATWQGNGAVPTLFAPPSNTLHPDSIVTVIDDSTGDASREAVQLIVLRTSPVAFSEPATPFPAASADATISQTGSSTANKIYTIDFTAGTYGGSFSTALTLSRVSNIASATVANPSVITTSTAHGLTTGASVVIAGTSGYTPSLDGTHVITVLSATTFSIPVNVTVSGTGGTVTCTTTETVGVASPFITSTDYLALLSNQTLADSTDFQVTAQNEVLTVEFRGNFAASNSPVLAVTNIDLLAPLGVSGTISLNTISLFRLFAATTATTLTLILAVRRTRASGEEAEIFQHDVILKRSLLNAMTMGPVDLPSYYTEAQSNARFAKILISGVRKLLDDGTIQLADSGGDFWSLGVSTGGDTIWTPL